MTRALVVGLLVISNAAAHAQATQPSPDLLAAHPFCRRKASTPETLVPDPRFDVPSGNKPADTAAVLSKVPVVVYPRSAMESGICGTVVVQIHIKADGKVGGARVIESLDKINGLDADALKTVSRWQFKPGLIDGKAVPTVITARVAYVLDALPMDPFDGAANVGRFVRVCGYLRPAPDTKADAGMRYFDFSVDKRSLVVRVPDWAKDLLDRTSTTPQALCVIGPVEKARGRATITVSRVDRLLFDPTAARLTDAVNLTDPGVSRPRILRQLNPQYTADAMRRKIQGQVEMDAVIMTDGRVGDIKVVRSLDSVYGLDDEAVATARLWRFEPALKDGRPVPVKIRIMMEFRLH
jgi:TonB family protein